MEKRFECPKTGTRLLSSLQHLLPPVALVVRAAPADRVSDPVALAAQATTYTSTHGRCSSCYVVYTDSSEHVRPQLRKVRSGRIRASLQSTLRSVLAVRRAGRSEDHGQPGQRRYQNRSHFVWLTGLPGRSLLSYNLVFSDRTRHMLQPWSCRAACSPGSARRPPSITRWWLSTC